MRLKLTGLLSITALAITLQTAFALEALKPEEIHLAQTPAERALDGLLQKDRAEVYGIFAIPAGDEPRPEEDLPPMTENVYNKAKSLSSKMQSQGCKGRTCGHDNYLTCGAPNNIPATILYHTIEEHEDWAAIMAVWKPEEKSGSAPLKGPLYKMIKTEKGWKLDDISCKEITPDRP
jgi:hypothetical protein